MCSKNKKIFTSGKKGYIHNQGVLKDTHVINNKMRTKNVNKFDKTEI